MSKTGRKNRSYSAEFKISVIMDMREHRLGYRETARKYNLGKDGKPPKQNFEAELKRLRMENKLWQLYSDKFNRFSRSIRLTSIVMLQQNNVRRGF